MAESFDILQCSVQSEDRFLIWTDLWSNMPLETCDIGAVPSRYVCLLDPPRFQLQIWKACHHQPPTAILF